MGRAGLGLEVGCLAETAVAWGVWLRPHFGLGVWAGWGRAFGLDVRFEACGAQRCTVAQRAWLEARFGLGWFGFNLRFGVGCFSIA